jgi:hypothetical protein
MLDSLTTTKVVPPMDEELSQPIVHPNYLVSIPEELLAHIISMSDIGIMCLTGSTLLRDWVVA